MWVDWFLAVKILRDTKLQTLLIVSGVGVGVGVIIFLAALIGGLQSSLIQKTLGTQAHVVIEPARERARTQLRSSIPVARRVEAAEQRIRSIDGWQQIVERLDRSPAVVAVSPAVTAPAFAVRGNGSEAVVVKGIDPTRFARIVDVPGRMVAGEFAVEARGAAIGVTLADDLGLGVGDRLRLQVADGTSELFTVRGLFDLGTNAANSTWVLVSLRSAQALVDLTGGANTIEVKVPAIYGAEDFARRYRRLTGLEVRSWMESNAELLTALKSQSASSNLIQVFVILAVAIGIASVLVVSVIQRSPEIGILRAMGTSRQRVLRVFLLQGCLVGLGGSVVGSALGAAMALSFRRAAVDPRGDPLFPIELDVPLFVFATVVATLTGLGASVLPARRAANLDPAKAIRND